MANRRNLGCELRDLIYFLYEDTLIPDLFDILGEDLAVQFVKVFGGMKIEVPSFNKVLELQRNIEIYENLSYINNEETVKAIADRYGITNVWVREIFRSMKKKYPEIEKFIQKMNEERKVRVTTKRPSVKK